MPSAWKLTNTPVFKKDDPGHDRPLSLSSVTDKIMEKVILGATEKYLKDNIVTGHNQHDFMRGKSFLSNLIFFYDQVEQPTLLIEGSQLM